MNLALLLPAGLAALAALLLPLRGLLDTNQSPIQGAQRTAIRLAAGRSAMCTWSSSSSIIMSSSIIISVSFRLGFQPVDLADQEANVVDGVGHE